MTRPTDMSDAIAPHGATGLSGYDEFEIDVEAILRDQLPNFFVSIRPAPLTVENVNALPERAKGAYMLFLKDEPVYAGKTDTRHGFRDRLARHAWTVQGRTGLDPTGMAFKAVRIMVFSAFDVEAILIDEIKKSNKAALPWNNSGFGSNDPGKNRDGQQPALFDLLYPIDTNFLIRGLPDGRISLPQLLQITKAKVPYLIRHAPLPEDVYVDDVPACASLHDILEMAVANLPPGWQITVLHGRVIAYHENREYAYKLEVLRS